MTREFYNCRDQQTINKRRVSEGLPPIAFDKVKIVYFETGNVHIFPAETVHRERGRLIELEEDNN